MGPEIWVALVAVFVSGGAVGTAGTLLTQWLVRRFDSPMATGSHLGTTEVEALRGELSEMGRHVRDLDARLDFTERLLDGALAPAPRVAGSELPEPGGRAGEPRPGSRVD
jgi:hypothetical protein